MELWQQVVLGVPFMSLGVSPYDGDPQVVVSESLHRAADLASGSPAFVSNMLGDPAAHPATLGLVLLPEAGSVLDRLIHSTLYSPPHVVEFWMSDLATRAHLERILAMEAIRVLFCDYTDPQLIAARLYPVSGEVADLVESVLEATAEPE